MRDPVPTIVCPIALFPPQVGKVQELIRRINEVKGIKPKAALAHTLHGEVEILLRCSAFDKDNIHCVSCQAISGAWNKTATLLLRTDQVLGRFLFKA